MATFSTDLPALLIIDMVKDNFDESLGMPLTALAKKTVPTINGLIGEFRAKDWPVVFSTDAYHKDDFIFEGKLPPHSIEGTEGATVIDDLDNDMVPFMECLELDHTGLGFAKGHTFTCRFDTVVA